MKIALASYEFVNNNLEFNLTQIEKALGNAKNKADMVCFGESLNKKKHLFLGVI